MPRERFKRNLHNKSIDIKSQIRESFWSVSFNGSKIDVKIEILKGKVVGFSLNLSYLEGDRRISAIRWDTAHGYLHKHEFWKSKKAIKDKGYLGMHLGDALTELYDELKENWKKYVKKMKEKGENSG